jgi:hypothetical protein
VSYFIQASSSWHHEVDKLDLIYYRRTNYMFVYNAQKESSLAMQKKSINQVN